MENEKQKERPEITVTKEAEGIIQFGTRKIVKPIGDSGHVILPKSLIGKMVEVYYLEEKNE